MVVTTKTVLVLAATLVVILLFSEILEGLVGNSPNLLMSALLLFAGGVGGWFARDQRIGMGTTAQRTE